MEGQVVDVGDLLDSLVIQRLSHALFVIQVQLHPLDLHSRGDSQAIRCFAAASYSENFYEGPSVPAGALLHQSWHAPP